MPSTDVDLTPVRILMPTLEPLTPVASPAPRFAVLAGTAALLAALAGCAGPAPVIEDGNPVDTEVTAPSGPGNGGSGGGASMIDPAHPWPAALPKPGGIISEFTGPNLVGEGGTYTVEFKVASLAEAQAYADALAAAGVQWMLGGELPDPAGESSVSVVAMTQDYMATLSVDVTSLVAEFSLLGTFE